MLQLHTNCELSIFPAKISSEVTLKRICSCYFSWNIFISYFVSNWLGIGVCLSTVQLQHTQFVLTNHHIQDKTHAAADWMSNLPTVTVQSPLVHFNKHSPAAAAAALTSSPLNLLLRIWNCICPSDQPSTMGRPAVLFVVPIDAFRRPRIAQPESAIDTSCPLFTSNIPFENPKNMTHRVVVVAR